MVQLQKDLKKIESAGIRIAGISYDSEETLREFADQQKITFPLLCDPGSKTIDAFGLRNKDVKRGSRQDGIPHPGTFLLDKDGIIRAKLFHGVRKRHSTDELIHAAKEIR